VYKATAKPGLLEERACLPRLGDLLLLDTLKEERQDCKRNSTGGPIFPAAGNHYQVKRPTLPHDRAAPITLWLVKFTHSGKMF
jgi:hypothetical protein